MKIPMNQPETPKDVNLNEPQDTKSTQKSTVFLYIVETEIIHSMTYSHSKENEILGCKLNSTYPGSASYKITKCYKSKQRRSK